MTRFFMKPTNFDQFAQSYDKVLADSVSRYGADVAYYHRYKVRLAAALSRRQPSRILDYGCGAGANLGYLAAAFPSARIAGCDLSAESLRVAASRHPEASLYDLGAGETPPGFYDLVFISNVLHHVPPADRPGLMAGIAGLMAPGGELFVFEHNPKNPVTRKVVRECPLDEDAVLLPLEETVLLAKNAGLDAADARYVLFFPASLQRLAFAERFLTRLPLGAQHCLRAVKKG